MYNKGLQLCEICPWRKQRSLVYLVKVWLLEPTFVAMTVRVFIWRKKKKTSLCSEYKYYYMILYMQKIKKIKKILHYAAADVWMRMRCLKIQFNEFRLQRTCSQNVQCYWGIWVYVCECNSVCRCMLLFLHQLCCTLEFPINVCMLETACCFSYRLGYSRGQLSFTSNVSHHF